MSLDIAGNIDRTRKRIERACDRVGRDHGSVELVAVSKTHTVESIRAAYDAGLRVFAENYAQELAEKAQKLRDLSELRWRFVGHLQRNKIKLVERAQAAVDTLDSMRLAAALSARAEDGGYVTEVLIQVNVGEEPQKSGCRVGDLSVLVDSVRELPCLDLRGLMTVAPHYDNPDDARSCFAGLRRLAEAHGLQALSMGMTDDLEQAIAEGSTMVRLGTAIFGPRRQKGASPLFT